MDVDGGVNSEKIVILDAGAQYSKLIDRLEIGDMENQSLFMY